MIRPHRGSTHSDRRKSVGSAEGPTRQRAFRHEHCVGIPSHGQYVTTAWYKGSSLIHGRGCVFYPIGSVRDRVLTDETFWNLSHEYYDGLTLEYDEKGRGPRTGASLALASFISSSAGFVDVHG